MENEVILTRKELYDLVWVEPMNIVAKRYGKSEATFTKICIDHAIPVPRDGHWARVRMGKAIERPPLPGNYKGPLTIKFTLNKKTASSSRKSKVQKPDPDTPAPPPAHHDPRVSAARKFLSDNIEKPSFRDGLIWTKGQLLKIAVSPKPETIDRACNFMNELIAALRKNGYELYVNNNGTFIRIGELQLPVHLRERFREVKPENKDYGVISKRYEPSGNFNFIMSFATFEREWEIKDGPLVYEAELIVEKLENVCIKIKKDQIETDFESRKNAWDRERKKEKEEKRQHELTAFRNLLADARPWLEALSIRNYLAALEKQQTEKGPLSSEQEAWFKWAYAKADWYDPHIKAADEFLTGADRDALANNDNAEAARNNTYDYLLYLSEINKWRYKKS